MKLLKSMILISVVLILGSCSEVSQGNICEGNAGLGIAQAYAIAWSYPDNLPQFVRKNEAFFREDGPSIQCGRALAASLQNAALSMPSPGAIRDHATDVATRSGAPHLGPKLGDDMVKTSTDMFRIASYLEELVNTCPELVNGNDVPYHNTEIYGLSNYIWRMLSGVSSPQQLKVFRDMTMEMNEWMLVSLGAAVPK